MSPVVLRTLRSSAVVALILLSPTSPLSSSEDNRHRELVVELMELTGAAELGAQVGGAMIEQMKPAMPQVPAEWWERFSAKIDSAEIVQVIVPIYEKHFTVEELQATLEFYKSPVGRAVLEKMPAVTQESMAAGQEWGRSVAQEILRELQADGFEVPQT